jgi:hypothetical protein
MSRFLYPLLLAAAMAAFFGSAQADETKDQAVNAAIADSATTAVGLAAGAVELNPLGPILSLAVKPLVLRYVATLPDTEQPAAYAAASSIWGGAAVNNACVTVAILTGGGFATACMLLGAMWGIKSWNDTEHERLFWEGCGTLRVYAQQPDLQCIYTRPDQQLALERPNLAAQAPEAP